MGRLAELSLHHRAVTLVLIAALTGLAVSRLGDLRTDVGYRALLGSDHPAIAAVDEFVGLFGGGLPFVIVWSCAGSAPCESIFDPDSLRMAQELADALAEVEGVWRVDGPGSTPLLVREVFGMPRARRLVVDGQPDPELQTLVPIALRDPLWRGQIVSPDARTAALLVHLESSEGAAAQRVWHAAQTRLRPYEERGYVFQFAGGPVEFVVGSAELESSMRRIVPAMLALIIVVLLALFRRFRAATAALATSGLAIVWAMGALAWLDWPQNSLTQALAPLVLVIGVCNALHLVSRYANRLAEEPDADRRELMLAVCTEIGAPCAMTSLTTAVGFATFTFSGLQSFRQFGSIAALGVIAALLLGFSLLPILLSSIPARRVTHTRVSESWSRALTALLRGVRRSAVAVLATCVALAGLSTWGVIRLRVDASFEELYGTNSAVVRWASFVARELREPETLEIALHPPADLELFSAESLTVVDELAAELTRLEGLGPSLSVLDLLGPAHQALYRRPLDLREAGAADRVAALRRLLRAEDPNAVRLFVSESAHALRLSLQASKLPQQLLRSLLEAVDRSVARLPAGWRATPTGPLAVVARTIEEIRATQLESFGLAGAAVLALLLVFFRSWQTALLGLLPTALPIGLTLGAMGVLGIALDVGSAMVAAVVLGIAVDDAIHLIVAYRARRPELPRDLAIEQAVLQVGRALSTTSVALALGFGILTLSPWQSVSSFGAVAAFSIAAALAAVLIVVPAVVFAANGRGVGSVSCEVRA